MRKILLILMVLMLAGISFGQDNYANWKYSQKVKVNTTTAGVSETQINFPLALRIDSSNFRYFGYTKAGGADLRFSKADGTHLNYEIERWRNGDTAAAIWVKVDSVFGSNSTQYILMYWGNSGAADSSFKQKVFDTAGGKFKHVMHLNEDGNTSSPGYYDATYNAYNGTAYNVTSASDVPGIIGACAQWNGSTQYMGFGNIYNILAGQNFSVSAWIKLTTLGTNSVIIGQRPSGSAGWAFEVNSSNQLFYTLDDGTTINQAIAGTNFAVDTWYHVAVAFNRSGASNDSAKAYVNGALIATYNINGATGSLSNPQGINISRRPSDNDRFFPGMIDEVRVNRIVSSSDWIKLNYETQRIDQAVTTYSLIQDTVKTWNSLGPTGMNDTTNWFPVSAIKVNDSLLFNATSVVNATSTGALSCKAMNITSGYSGAWSISGQTLTCANGFSDDGITGAHNYGNGVTLNGASSTFHVGSGVGTVTATSCALTMNGTTGMVIDDDKGLTVKNLTLGASAKVTSSGGTGTTYSSATNPLTLGASAVLTLNTTASFILTGSGSLGTFGAGSSLAGSAYIIWYIGGSSIAAIMGDYTHTGAGTQYFQMANGAQTGSVLTFSDVTIPTAPYYLFLGINLASATATFAGDVTCNVADWGNDRANGTLTINWGAGTFSFKSYNSTYNGVGTTNHNLQTAIISCMGNWTYGSNHTVTPGTSVVNITNTSTATTNNKHFYDLNFNASTKVIGVTGSLRCDGDLTYTAGIVTPAVIRDSVVMDVTYASTTDSVSQRDTLYCGGSYTYASNAKLKTRTGKVKFYGTSRSDVTTSTLTMLSFDIVGDDATKEVRALDDMTVGMIRDSTGFLNMNGETLTVDTLIVDDTAHFEKLTVNKLLIVNGIASVDSSVYATGATVSGTGKLLASNCLVSFEGTGDISLAWPPTGPFSYATSPIVMTAGVEAAQDITNDGCVADSFDVYPALPVGLTIGHSTGTIYGTPTVPLSKTGFTVRGYNNGPDGLYVDSCYDTITINPYGPNISYAASPAKCTVDVFSSFDMTNTGGDVDSVTAATLPGGLTIDKNTGTISGTPPAVVAELSYDIIGWNVTATDTFAFMIAVLPQKPAFTYPSSPALDTINKAVTHPVLSTGGTIDSFKIMSGVLPVGMSLNGSTGAIGGTPTAITAATTATVRGYNITDSVDADMTITVFRPGAGIARRFHQGFGFSF